MVFKFSKTTKKAYLFAQNKHENHLYPGTNLPYLHHLNLTCLNALKVTNCTGGYDTDTLISLAYLHDVLEDTDTTVDELNTQFKKKIITGIKALTKNKNMRKKDQMLDSINRIYEACDETAMIKLADRIANLNTYPTHWSIGRCKRYIEESYLILDKLGCFSSILTKELRLYINYWENKTIQ